MRRHQSPPPESFLPLSPVQYLALLALVEDDIHAYALVKEVARRTAGRVRPGPASIHRTIRQLLELGLVEESDARPAPELDDARRRYFAATELGRAVAAAETERLYAIVAAARQNLRAEP